MKSNTQNTKIEAIIIIAKILVYRRPDFKSGMLILKKVPLRHCWDEQSAKCRNEGGLKGKIEDPSRNC